jgi:glycogen(starch) synthase
VRIALITRELSGVTAYTGGIGVRYRALAVALADLGHDVHVFTAFDPIDAPAQLPDVHVHRLPRPAVNGLWFLPLTHAVRASGPYDAVCAPEWVGDGFIYARSERAGPLVTNLTTALDQIIALSPNWQRPLGMRVKHVFQRRLERMQTEHSTALIACSRAMRDWTHQIWDIDDLPTHVVHNAVDVGRTRALAAADSPPSALSAEGPLVVFFGRVEIRKGVGTLIQAMLDVWADHPDAQLAMIGHDTHSDHGGWVSDQLRRRAGHRADRLHLLGAQPPEVLFPTVRAADVVALPSRWEAFGLAALEAMALGRACALTSGSGFAEFCRDEVDGLLVPPDDADALAGALLRLLGDSALRARLGASASTRAEGFDATRMARGFAEVFAGLADA